MGDGARLTGVEIMSRFRDTAGDLGRTVVHTAVSVSEPGDVAASAIARFLPDTVITVNGYRDDGSDWFAVFEYVSDLAPAQTIHTSASRVIRALDLTGVGAVLGTSVLARRELASMYRSHGIGAANDWSTLDLLLGLVINLFHNDLVNLVDVVSQPASDVGPEPRRRDRMEDLLREWAAFYRGPESTAD